MGVKNIALSQLWHRLQLQLRFHPWCRNFHMPRVWLKKREKKKKQLRNNSGVLFASPWVKNLLVSMRTWVQSLALLSGQKIWGCHKLWHRSQLRLGSNVAVAVMWASAAALIWIWSWEPSICCRSSHKKQKKKLKIKIKKCKGSLAFSSKPFLE